jgi:hypothetical protein
MGRALGQRCYVAQGSVLLEAEELINGDRSAAYGTPEDNFRRWANLCWASDREGIKHLTPADLAMVMVLGKLARETNAHRRDNLVDAAAYIDIFRQVHEVGVME